MRFAEPFLKDLDAEDSTTSTDNLFQHFTVTMVQKIFPCILKNPNIPCGNLGPLLLALSNIRHTEEITALLFVHLLHTRKL